MRDVPCIGLEGERTDSATRFAHTKGGSRGTLPAPGHIKIWDPFVPGQDRTGHTVRGSNSAGLDRVSKLFWVVGEVISTAGIGGGSGSSLVSVYISILVLFSI